MSGMAVDSAACRGARASPRGHLYTLKKKLGMDAQTPRELLRVLEEIPEPRRHNLRHKLIDILTLALIAVICGADDWVSVEEYAQCKEEWLRTFLELPCGIPSHDTFGRVFARLDPAAFEQ